MSHTMRAVLFIAAAALAVEDNPGKIQSQPPAVIPDGGRFQGEVQGGVHLLPTGGREACKIYYTVASCCSCDQQKIVDLNNVGIDKDTKELQWIKETIPINSVGEACISAVAVTEGQSPSKVVKSLFSIAEAASHLRKPVVEPPQGKYREFVTVKMLAPGVTGDIFYTVDGELPSQNKKGTKYEGPFQLRTPGLHHVAAVVVVDGVLSPTEATEYEVVLPVAYKVQSEAGFGFATVGDPFVVMFQGFKPTPKTRVFLSTVNCTNTPSHELIGCNCPGGVVPLKLQLHVTTLDAPTNHVYVCFSNNGGSSWSAIRQEGASGDQLYTFPLRPSPLGSMTETNGLVAGSRVAEDTPFDWSEYQRQQQPSSSGSMDVVVPAVVVLAILATGFFITFRRRG
ncbi:hypothetical protein DIPPA_63573 [Diplonema papillatum]|nr:hypothetical protein DIPPA_63573 [Diplonema papillatum]